MQNKSAFVSGLETIGTGRDKTMPKTLEKNRGNWIVFASECAGMIAYDQLSSRYHD
jgi:hypothetical protein